ncbi:M15 family metallopeptidase [Sphingomonas dokdonensis]|uniref:Bacteriophage tail tape measure N-terminal domain-containing protein n=1 Tax=Sphingomonas dokdonensis TaxID=344880 RepID=A0A245ZHJ6_9SPHN|nr:M15 family metallopeptidase [Sphingomonas dokdonensis]OWK29211.1 hypothetical protein SPDO_21920 [Sphingomonas dokdonensis]
MATSRTASTAIRLGITGDPEVKRRLDDIGATGDAAAQRMAKSFVKAETEVEAAIARRERQMAKLNAIMPQTAMQMRVDSAAATGFGEYEGSARRSSGVFAQMLAEQDQLEQRARALRAAIDPAWAAQQRFNTEIGEARELISRGAISLDDYVAKLRLEQQALDAATTGHGRATGATNRTGAAFAQAAPQIQDFVIQATMGGNVMQALVVQGGQLAGQLIYVEGKVGSVARALMGPFGIAAQVALMVAAPFVAKLFEGADGADKQRKALEEQRKAVLDLAAAQEKALVTAERRQALDTAQIKIALDDALSTRQQTQALLEQARAEEQMNNSAGAASIAGEAIGEVQRQSRDRVNDLERQLAENARSMADLQRGYDAGFARMIGQRVDAMRDPRTGINLIYQRQRSALEGDPELQRNGKLLAAKLDALADARDRELKAVEDSTKALRRDTETLTSAQVAKALRGEFAGIKINSTDRSTAEQAVLYARYKAGNGPLAAPPGRSYHERGQAIDISKSSGITQAELQRFFDIRGIQAKIIDEGRHLHVQWQKGKFALDEWADAAKRAKEEAEQLTSLRLFTDGNALGQSLIGVRQAITVQRADFNNAARSVFGDELNGNAMAQLVGDYDQRQRVEVDKWNEENSRRLNKQEEDFRYLGNLWSTVLTGGTKGVWDMFRQQGLQVISELLARWMAFGNVQGATGAAGGFVSAIGKLFGGKGAAGTSYADPSAGWGSLALPGVDVAGLAASSLPRFAVGTHYSSAGAALIGENGPELVSLPRGSRVTPAAETRRILAANDTAPVVHQHFNLSGNMMTPEFWAEIQAVGDTAAMRGAAGGAAIGQAEIRAQGARRLGRRW